MRKFFAGCLLLVSITAFAQDDEQDKLDKIADSISAEAKRLYRSEMASWYGTDLFLEAYKERANIGGYFSYADGDSARCIFFSREENAKVIGTISFDKTYDIHRASLDLSERPFSAYEKEVHQLRQKGYSVIKADTFFKSYSNSSLNLIPLVNGTEKKIYILTGPKINGVVIFGNDYLLTFDKDNNLLSKKRLHRNIIKINYGKNEQNGDEAETSMHSHLPETGDFITATDICTLMLYEKFTTWKQHAVVSKDYFSNWDCKTDKLTILPMSVIKKIREDIEKRKNEKNN